MTAIDNLLLFFIQDNLHHPLLDPVMLALTWAGEMGLIWYVIAFGLLFSRRWRLTGLAALAALLLADILGEFVLKEIFRRPRPFLAHPEITLLISGPASFSFPSVHALTSFTAATIFGGSLRRLAPLFFTLAILIAYSRLYFFVHYPTDVLGGAILGFICGFGALLALKRLRVALPHRVDQ
jgi:undecaprenyl-diphosphatase